MNQAEIIHEKIKPIISQLTNHTLYPTINTFKRIQAYMEYDVFTTWDCMCLIKQLYGKLTTVTAPWLPPEDAYSAALMNSIIGEEETDLCADGINYASHFEIYIDAMQQAGANTSCITEYIQALKKGLSMTKALELCGTKSFVQKYVKATLSYFDLETHQLAAGFAFGREAIAPVMFVAIIKHLNNKEFDFDRTKLNGIIYFCERHINLDTSDHFPKMLKMLNNLCGTDRKKWLEVEEIAFHAANAKLEYFNNMQEDIEQIKE